MSIQSMARGVGRSLEKPELWLVRCVLVAAVIAVVYYSGDKAKDAPTQAILVFLGLAAVGFHYIGAKKACAAWFNRSAFGLIGWLLVVGGAVVWEVNSQMGISSANQENLSTIQRTAAVRSQTNDDEVNRVAALLLTKQSEAAWKSDPGPLGAIQAKIDAARAHKFWTSTESCTSPPGKTTRDWCNGYRQLQADKAMASRREVLSVEIAALNKELADARAKRSSGPAVASMDRADLRNLKRLTGLGDQDIELSQSLLVVLVMALFLTVAGWMIKAEEFAGKPTRPWFNWHGAAARIRKMWDGKDIASSITPIENRYSPVTKAPIDINALLRTHVVRVRDLRAA